jgi:DNA invertase Pin-like site-specific DNA recombinase
LQADFHGSSLGRLAQGVKFLTGIRLHRLAEQRGFEIVHEYTDQISGAKAKRPALDQMMTAADGREFDTVLVWAADRLARSVRHFLEMLDTLNPLGIEVRVVPGGGPLGRAVVIIASAVAELERNSIIERVRAGLRRARLEGRVLGRKPLKVTNLTRTACLLLIFQRSRGTRGNSDDRLASFA